MTHKNERVLSVAELARVEGEGALYIRTADGTVEQARLDIYEPPLFFEAFADECRTINPITKRPGPLRRPGPRRCRRA